MVATSGTIFEIIARDNLNVANLMQTFKNLHLRICSTEFLDSANKYIPWVCVKSLFKWWRHLHYQRNDSKRTFEHIANLMQTFEKVCLQNY